MLIKVYMLVSKSVCTFIVLEAGSDADALGCLVYYYTAQSVGVVSKAERTEGCYSPCSIR